MTDEQRPWRPRTLPSGKASRLGQFGRLAGGIAGGMLAEGARRLAGGERPRMRDMLLTRGNFHRLADRLSHLRGAAMKLGQMISLDAGDLLPPELTAILASLREHAHHMPPAQLERVLIREWGEDWRLRFTRFDAIPIAAASIGQVHRATARDGRELAIKFQYPGVRESIDSDVDNVSTLLRMSGLLPRGLDLGPLLADAKRQLREEADYVREGEQMQRFAALLADTPGLLVPELVADLSSDQVLAMTFVAGEPIEGLVTAPQSVRDEVAGALIRLVLRELFEFGVMQTDPNFANYRYQPDTGRIVLLDFGATRTVEAGTSAAYRAMLRAGLAGDRNGLREAALGAGILGNAAVSLHRARIDQMIDIVVGEMNRPGPFDFGDRSFVAALRDSGLDLAADQRAWHVPPADILFTQRKISGTALLAARLKARVDVRSVVTPYVEHEAVGADKSGMF
jgi:predicted unusual protein kinase regulating ubiquinone biosynthesis (AarF/ABC1/UbiB family)